jgi:short-subunit dehydrogenase
LEEALAKRGVEVSIRELDVTKPATIKLVVEEIQKVHGHIDVLINNAGYGIAGFFEDLTEDEIRAQMETNFFGVQNTCREVVPLMRRQKAGRIINISSIAGQVSTPTLGAYSASKWALEAFSESLYFELSLFGVSVVLVEPGAYPTKIFSDNAHFAKNLHNPQSPYYALSAKLREIYNKNFKPDANGRDPDHVAALIEKIVANPRPRLRYMTEFPSWVRVMAQKTLPPSLLANIFRRTVHANK